jgi:glutamate 5-kinase
MPKKRIVIKVGSHTLTHKEKIAKERILELVKLVVLLKRRGFEVLLVSSGAIFAGYSKIALDRDDTINQQVLASIGQPYLLSIYQEFFDHFDMLCAQVLLPSAFFDDKAYMRNAQNTVERLLKNGVTPIINENDTVSTEEIMEGDNDMLSAFVTHFFDAELLVMLSRFDGYTELGEPMKVMNHLPPLDPTQPLFTKLKACQFLIEDGKEMFLSSGKDLSDVKSFLLDGVHQGGTLFRR